MLPGNPGTPLGTTAEEDVVWIYDYNNGPFSSLGEHFDLAGKSANI